MQIIILIPLNAKTLDYVNHARLVRDICRKLSQSPNQTLRHIRHSDNLQQRQSEHHKKEEKRSQYLLSVEHYWMVFFLIILSFS